MAVLTGEIVNLLVGIGYPHDFWFHKQYKISVYISYIYMIYILHNTYDRYRYRDRETERVWVM